MSFTLRSYQEEAVEACLEILQSKKNSCKELVVLPTGCHEKGYNIKMFDGTLKPVENILLGDQVMGPDGTPRNVQRIIQGSGKIYKISPNRRSEPFYVNEDHILYLEATTVENGKKGTYPKNVEVSVKDYIGWSKSRKHMYKLKRASAENSYEGNVRNTIDPYYLGLWLGDGSSNCTDITTADQEVKEYLKDFSKRHNLVYKERGKSEKNKAVTISLTTPRGQSNPLRSSLVKLNLINNKHIPIEYKTANLETRKKVLEGILDSDGYLCKRGKVEISFTNKKLTYDTVEMLNSIGIFTSVKEGTSICTNCEDKRPRPRYRIGYTARGILKPRVERRKHKGHIANIDPSRTGFKVEFDRVDDYYGFTLDKDNLYLDWQFIVHHNCGKSLVQAEVAKRLDYPLVILCPSKELLEQNSKKLDEFGVKHTICSASAGKREISKLTLATIGSIKNNWQEFKDLGVKGILIDEANLGVKSGSTIRKFIKKAGITKTAGLTATPCVLESSLEGASIKMLNRVRWKLFTDIRYVYQIQDAVKNNYWSKLLYASIQSDESMLKDNTSGSDFTLDSQKRFYKSNDINGKIKEELKILKDKGRKSTIIFVPTIEEAEILYSQIPNSAIVHSKMKKSEREFMVESFKNLEIPVIINPAILQIGFDHPQLDSIIMAKPTKSVNLYYQICGRACRIHPEKKDAVIVDMVGNFSRFGKIEDFTYENVPFYSWGMFGKNGVLLSDFPIAAKNRPTKQSLIEAGKRKAEEAKSNKVNKTNPMITWGMYSNTRFWDAAKGKDPKRFQNYMAWIWDKYKKNEWNFYGKNGDDIKEAIVEYLKLPK